MFSRKTQYESITRKKCHNNVTKGKKNHLNQQQNTNPNNTTKILIIFTMSCCDCRLYFIFIYDVDCGRHTTKNTKKNSRRHNAPPRAKFIIFVFGARCSSFDFRVHIIHISFFSLNFCLIKFYTLPKFCLFSTLLNFILFLFFNSRLYSNSCVYD